MRNPHLTQLNPSLDFAPAGPEQTLHNSLFEEGKITLKIKKPLGYFFQKKYNNLCWNKKTIILNILYNTNMTLLWSSHMLYYYTVLLDYTSLLVPEKQYGKYVQIPSIQKMAGKIKWTLFYPKRSQKELWMTGKCHNWLHRSHNSRNIAIFILYSYYTHLSKLLPTLTMWFWMQLLSLIKMKLAPSFISVIN